MDFKQLVEQFPQNDQWAFMKLAYEFTYIQKCLADPDDPLPKGKRVNRARELSEELKKDPWNISVDLLWEICLNLEDWEKQIKEWSNSVRNIQNGTSA